MGRARPAGAPFLTRSDAHPREGRVCNDQQENPHAVATRLDSFFRCNVARSSRMGSTLILSNGPDGMKMPRKTDHAARLREMRWPINRAEQNQARDDHAQKPRGDST